MTKGTGKDIISNTRGVIDKDCRGVIDKKCRDGIDKDLYSCYQLEFLVLGQGAPGSQIKIPFMSNTNNPTYPRVTQTFRNIFLHILNRVKKN